jgi:hypothetical protein
MKTIRVTIQGTSPLLINRFKENDEQPEAVKKSTKKDYGTPRAQAEKTPYRDEDTLKLWLPTIWVTGTIRTVASDYKLPGTRKSVKSISGGAIIPVEEKMYFEEDYHLKDIEVDSRPCVVQRARIMRHRARLEKWSCTLDLQIDETILPVDHVQAILSDAGKRAGLGDYRPQKGGPFGRFFVSSWKEIED